MAVIVKYVVVRDGKEDMIFSTKKEAEAYDKMLDVAKHLSVYLQRAELDISEDQLDELTFFLAQHREPLGRLLKGGSLETAAADTKPSVSSPPKTEIPAAENTDASSDSTGNRVAKRSQATKSKAAA